MIIPIAAALCMKQCGARGGSDWRAEPYMTVLIAAAHCMKQIVCTSICGKLVELPNYETDILSDGLLQLATAKLEAPRFIAGALRDEAVGGLPGMQRRDIRGEVLPAKGPARAPWPKLHLQVGPSLSRYGLRRYGLRRPACYSTPKDCTRVLVSRDRDML